MPFPWPTGTRIFLWYEWKKESRLILRFSWPQLSSWPSGAVGTRRRHLLVIRDQLSGTKDSFCQQQRLRSDGHALSKTHFRNHCPEQTPETRNSLSRMLKRFLAHQTERAFTDAVPLRQGSLISENAARPGLPQGKILSFDPATTPTALQTLATDKRAYKLNFSPK